MLDLLEEFNESVPNFLIIILLWVVDITLMLFPSNHLDEILLSNVALIQNLLATVIIIIAVYSLPHPRIKVSALPPWK